MPTTTHTEIVALRAAGTAVLLAVDGPDLPRVLHWGADVGPDVDGVATAVVPGVPHGTLDEVWPLTVLPGAADGWPGRPALRGHRGGRDAFPRWVVERVDLGAGVGGGPGGRPDAERDGSAPAHGGGAVGRGPSAVSVLAADAELGLALELRIALDPAGVLVVTAALTNTGAEPYVLDALTPLLPVPAHAREVLDLAGRWARESEPQRSPLHVGVRSRESWRGRPGHDATPLLVAGTPGFGFRHGEVWGVHVAWSGDAEHLVERVPEGCAVLGGGEIPRSLVLAPGERHAAPALVAAWSDAGLDGLSARLHAHVRARPSHPASPRPVVCNTWEAVFFDHDLARLTALADRAASVGAERFVLDDGWFAGRRDDTTSLGDWTVDPDVWPGGLHRLVDHVRALGMQFGLWVEPEMVSPDSALARAHPEWLLTTPGRPARGQRWQQVLDLARPEAFAHVLDALDALVAEYDLDALKWDHNRDLVEPVHDGAPGAHAQTLAVYRLLDELRARHPRCEIETCASGGGRADLGVLARTDRIWASDTTDPVERQAVQRWTGLLLPPELVGAHVGSPRAGTTGRRSDLGLRLVTALFGHAGIEWDLAAVAPEELVRLREWVALHKELRGLLHTGETVRVDDPGDGALLHGVVGPDGAVFAYVRLATTVDVVPPRLRLPGLDPARRHRVRVRPEASPVPATGRLAQPPWVADGVELTGAALARVGLAAPVLHVEEGLVLQVTAL